MNWCAATHFLFSPTLTNASLQYLLGTFSFPLGLECPAHPAGYFQVQRSMRYSRLRNTGHTACPLGLSLSLNDKGSRPLRAVPQKPQQYKSANHPFLVSSASQALIPTRHNHQLLVINMIVCFCIQQTNLVGFLLSLLWSCRLHTSGVTIVTSGILALSFPQNFRVHL